MNELPEIYFERDTDWYDWLLQNHNTSKGVYLIFYKLELNIPSMRWEEAVKVALCFGWIDSTVKSLGNGKRRQYFCHRNPKSTWSALNKKHIKELEAAGLIHESGYKMIDLAKKTGTWTTMDDVENGVIPEDLKKAFDKNERAFENYQNFARGYRKSYLSWLHNAKREETKQKRIAEIITLCERNIKSRDNWKTMKSEVFEVGLLDRYHITIPEDIFKPFAEAKLSRVMIKAKYQNQSVKFYAAVQRDKNTDDFKMMFGKRLQKELGVVQNDYFEMQLFKDNSKYGVDMPEELDAVFKSDLEAHKIFETLTAGKKRSIIYAISRYKNSQTRIDKALIMCENLKRGHLNPYTILKPQ